MAEPGAMGVTFRPDYGRCVLEYWRFCGDHYEPRDGVIVASEKTALYLLGLSPMPKGEMRRAVQYSEGTPKVFGTRSYRTEVEASGGLPARFIFPELPAPANAKGVELRAVQFRPRGAE